MQSSLWVSSCCKTWRVRGRMNATTGWTKRWPWLCLTISTTASAQRRRRKVPSRATTCCNISRSQTLLSWLTGWEKRWSRTRQCALLCERLTFHPFKVRDHYKNSRILFLLIFTCVRVPTCRFTGIDRTACALSRSATDQQILFIEVTTLPFESVRQGWHLVETSSECVISVSFTWFAITLEGHYWRGLKESWWGVRGCGRSWKQCTLRRCRSRCVVASLVERGSPSCTTRSETVVGQVCEGVRLQSDRPDITSNTSPIFSRSRLATSFYPRDVFDKMLLVFAVPTAVSKDTMSVKLAGMIGGVALDVTRYDMVSLLRMTACCMQVDGVPSQKGCLHDEVHALVPSDKVSTDNIRVKETVRENHPS